MLAWLLPPACVACNRLLRPDAQRGLCSSCLAELVPTEPGSIGQFSHEGPLRRALRALKYDRDLSRVGPLADVVALALSGSRFDLATAVPLHPRRQRRRGFNQSELLLRRALRSAGITPPVSLLRRTRATPPQVGLPAARRRDNVAGAFAIRPGAAPSVRGRTVLLFDDVITTGSTLRAAAAPLCAAGAQVTYLALLQAVA